MFGARRCGPLVSVLRQLGYAMIRTDNKGEGSGIISTFPPVDRGLLQAPEDRKQFVQDIREGYRQGWQGPAQDDLLINRPWGFRLADIPVRIDIWQGERDRNVPLRQAHYQHDKIPHSRLTLWSDLGHLGLLVRWQEVLASLIE
jgi:pimeloyl-ACP methyl ester carboxylesterase